MSHTVIQSSGHIALFLDFLKKEKRGSDHTIRCYRSDLNQMEAFMTEAYEECDLTAIQSEWLRSWVVAMVKAGKSARTIHRLSLIHI